MQQVDRWVGAMLALLGTAVLWSSRAFPAVPGQKVGAGFLPGIVGAGILLCALLLVWRSTQSPVYMDAEAGPRNERYLPAAVVVAACLGYILLAERLGFLIVAPLCLLAVFLAFRARVLPSLLWAVVGALVVHVVFYK
ncbi:MAG TPA: tripartite tricarboxylate transporter TctB family protein, partial [Lautropia sp.]|nr:tripartite tricarboxylate transporter TctB family protein [Lautropia sp.]